MWINGEIIVAVSVSQTIRYYASLTDTVTSYDVMHGAKPCAEAYRLSYSCGYYPLPEESSRNPLWLHIQQIPKEPKIPNPWVNAQYHVNITVLSREVTYC